MSIISEYQKFGWRILWFAGQVPLFPNSDFSDEWTSTLMINKGQMAINIVDEKMFFCSDTQIIELATGGGGTSPYITIVVTGSTYNVNETEYDRINYIINNDCTITIDTDMLSTNTILSFKVNGSYTVNVETEGSETIDDETTQPLGQYDNMVITNDTNNYYII